MTVNPSQLLIQVDCQSQWIFLSWSIVDPSCLLIQVNCPLSQMKSKPSCLWPCYEYFSQWAGTRFRLNKLNQEVRHCPGHQGNCLDHPQCSVKSQNSGFKKKIIFSIFWCPKMSFFNTFRGPNFFLWVHKPFLASRNMF